MNLHTPKRIRLWLLRLCKRVLELVIVLPWSRLISLLMDRVIIALEKRTDDRS